MNLWKALVCACLVFAGQTPARAADSSTLAGLKISLGEWERYKRQSTACKWANPVSNALFAADARLVRRLSEIDDPKAKLLFVAPSPSAAPCGGDADKEAKLDGAIRTWMWLTRLKSYAEFGAQKGWMNGLVAIPPATLKTHDAQRLATARELAARIGQDKLDAQIARLKEEALTVHGLICVARRGPKSAAQCPKLSASFQSQVPAGNIRAEEVAAAATLLSALAAVR